MKVILNFAFFLVLTMGGIVSAQISERNLILEVEVYKIPEPTGIESSHFYHMVDYKVISVCQGDFDQNTIRVAQNINLAKKLAVGDRINLSIESTDRFRVMAKFLLEDVGYQTPAEFIADFILVHHRPSSSGKCINSP